MKTTYTKRELGEARQRVHENPIPPVIRRYDRLHKLFMRELDLDSHEVTGIAFDELEKLTEAMEDETDDYNSLEKKDFFTEAMEQFQAKS